jgi:hypothetical protein
VATACVTTTPKYGVEAACDLMIEPPNANTTILLLLLLLLLLLIGFAEWFARLHMLAFLVFASLVLLAEGIFMIVVAVEPDSVSADHQSILWQVLGFQWYR